MVVQFRIPYTIFNFRTEALGSAAGRSGSEIFKKFLTVNTQERFCGQIPFADVFPDFRSERASLHFPEFGNPYLGGINFKGSSHRRKKDPMTSCSHPDQMYLVSKAVDCINDIIIRFKVKLLMSCLAVDLLNGCNLCLRIDLEQPFF